MTVSIDRFSVADGFATFSHSAGERISASGDWGSPASVAEGRAWRDQIIGLIQQSGKTVPVTSTDDSTVDGYYRITGGSITPRQSALIAGHWDWQLELERLPDYSSVSMEAISLGTDRPDKHASVTAKPWHSIPSDAVAHDRDGTTTAYYTRTGPGGSVKWWTAVGPGYTNADPTWRVAPGDYFDMAATFKVGGYAVTGTQIGPTTSGWTLDNGLIKMTGGTSGTVTLEWPDGAGTAYGRDITLTFGYQNATFGWTAFATNKAVSVLKNEADEVVIRLMFELVPAFTSQSYVFFTDIALRRGSFMFLINQTTRSAALKQGMSLGEAMTVTGSAANEIMRTSSNDADGNRTVFISARATATSSSLQNAAAVASPAADSCPAGTWFALAGGTNSSDIWSYAVGCEYAGSSAVDPNRYTDLRDQYMAEQAIIERPTVTRGVV